MLNIVHFSTNRARKTKEFGLDDLSDDTLSLSSVGVAKRTLPEGDWSNQELASLHLAVQLLKRAGVAVEMDRGLTDDGSPWYVFCDSYGDVLVHFARIDLAYIIDGVGLAGPIKGETLEDLINKFVNTTTEKQAEITTVFDLSKHRQNKVFVHPAAQLVALIWAAMIVKDAAAANATEAGWTTTQEESYISSADVSEFVSTAFSHTPKQIVAGTSEHFSSVSFVKSRDALSLGLQSAGLLSLGYFLIGPESMSPGAVLDRIRMEANVNEERGAAQEPDYKASHVFFDVLEILGNLGFITQDESSTPQYNSAADVDRALGTDDRVAATTLDTILEMGLSVDQPVDFFTLDTLTYAQPAALWPQDAAEAVTPRAAIDELGDSRIIDAFFYYLTGFVVGSLDGDEALVADLINLTGNTADNEALGGLVIDDSEAIAVIINFLSSAEHEVIAYRDDDIHIIDYRGDGGSDTISVSWTFADGSQVVIVGASADLHSLDVLF